jgi:hypothetical protein
MYTSSHVAAVVRVLIEEYAINGRLSRSSWFCADLEPATGAPIPVRCVLDPSGSAHYVRQTLIQSQKETRKKTL